MNLGFSQNSGGGLSALFINQFLLEIVKIAFPNHYNAILTPTCEVVSAWAEVGCICIAFVAIQSVKDVALAQIPDFESSVIARRNEVPAVWVEGDLIYNVVVSIVLLQAFF